MKKTIRIIFMGTPHFSVPALESLAQQDDIDVCLVVTQPDRPKGRGKKMAFSPVKNAALSLGLDLFQPETLKAKEAIEKLSSLAPDFFVVTAFGQILTQAVLDIPKIYPINIHASLLPKYRGASPIQASILNMDKKTGVTTMVMAKKMDAGDILLTAKTPISQQDTAQDLHDRLGILGGELIIKTIFSIIDGKLKPTPQDHAKATFVKLLNKKDGKIDWTQNSDQILAHVNAMMPWPGSFALFNDRHIKIFRAVVSDTKTIHEPGVIHTSDNTGIHVATGNGTLTILELMGPSGKRLNARQFLCGNKIEPLSRFDL
ncbi:MAG: methionyl-tRNA formyltransferase [Desulfobacula sp.]|nr:methionyl-tRNA formyltransferase [Desulfobacula sp.]